MEQSVEVSLISKEEYARSVARLVEQAWEAGFKAGLDGAEIGQQVYQAFLEWYQQEVVGEFPKKSEYTAHEIAGYVLDDILLTAQVVRDYLRQVEGRSELYLSAMEKMAIEHFGSDCEDGQYDRVKEATQGVLEGLDFPPKPPTLDKLLQDY